MFSLSYVILPDFLLPIMSLIWMALLGSRPLLWGEEPELASFTLVVLELDEEFDSCFNLLLSSLSIFLERALRIDSFVLISH